MSINPVQKTEPAIELQVTQPGARSSPPPSVAAAKSAASDPGTSPKQNLHDPQNAASTTEFPQDEVQVLRDNGTNGDIIVKFMDHFGNVVLQIPSSQVLGVAHAIDQELALEAKARANAGEAQPEGNGGKVHGH